MTNLPISTNTPPPSCIPAKSAQADNPANDQEVTPFASLLAQQIGDSVSATLSAVQFTTESMTSPDKDRQDANSVIAITPTDPANTLAAIMLQLPTETRTPVALPAVVDQQAGAMDVAALSAASGADASQPGAVNISPATFPLSHRSGVNNNAAASNTALQHLEISATPSDRANIEPLKLNAPVGAADSQTIAVNLTRDTPKHGGVSAVQTSHNDSQANITMVMPAATPNAQIGRRAGDDALAVNTPLGSDGWADDFSQQISWMSTQKNQIAELRLNPPNLGPLDVVLTITDKQASIQFSSPHGAVRDAVENALPKLREIFADNGIMLGNTTVSDQSPRERNAAGFMNQGFDSGSQRTDDATKAASLAPDNVPIPVARRHLGIVDTFA